MDASIIADNARDFNKDDFVFKGAPRFLFRQVLFHRDAH